MPASKADIIAQLQKEILPLQGFRPLAKTQPDDLGLGPIKNAFPNRQFPLGAIHEFCCSGLEDAAATQGFVSGILSKLMNKGGATVWISSCLNVFPPALKLFDIQPENIVFIELKKAKDLLWATEEALKCEGLAAVIAEIPELSFTASRRFQLAVEQSRVTGFVIRVNPRRLNTTASLTRWQISPLPSIVIDGLPGIGFPRWNVHLSKVRNGQPGEWQVEYAGGVFRHFAPLKAIPGQQKRKTG